MNLDKIDNRSSVDFRIAQCDEVSVAGELALKQQSTINEITQDC